MELRDMRWMPARVRALDESEAGGEGIVEAYVTVFDVDYRIYFWYERIASGAFGASLTANPVLPIFWEHEWVQAPMGHTLSAEQDEHGVKVRVQLFLWREQARAIWETLRAGGLGEWSIGFYPEVWHTEVREDGAEVDVIEVARLAEASLVVRGANPETETLDVRNEQDAPRRLGQRLPATPPQPPAPPAPVAELLDSGAVKLPWGDEVSLEQYMRVRRSRDLAASDDDDVNSNPRKEAI